VDLAEQLKQQAIAQGFAVAGVAATAGSERLALRNAALERWLAAGYQADMAWMNNPKRRQVEQLLPGVRSLLAVGLNYYVEQQQQVGVARIARYGWGRDYHRVIEQRLKRLGRWLELQQPDCHWRVCVDSAPLMDKAWAEEAGIGWIGKNGNLISKSHGSWLLLGHLLTTVELTPSIPASPLCGSCSACLPACPTGAITEPFVVDSRRCMLFTRSKIAILNCRLRCMAGLLVAIYAKRPAPGIKNKHRQLKILSCNHANGCCKANQLNYSIGMQASGIKPCEVQP